MTNDNIIIPNLQRKNCHINIPHYNNIVALPIKPDSDYVKIKCIFNIENCPRVDACLRQKNIAPDECDHYELVLQASDFLTFIE